MKKIEDAYARLIDASRELDAASKAMVELEPQDRDIRFISSLCSCVSGVLLIPARWGECLQDFALAGVRTAEKAQCVRELKRVP